MVKKYPFSLSIIFLCYTYTATIVLATSGQPQICPRLKIDAFTENDLIINDCVSACNKEAAKLAQEAHEKVAPTTSESYLGWLTQKAVELGQHSLISLNPSTKMQLTDIFMYDGFKQKYDALAKESTVKKTQQY